MKLGFFSVLFLMLLAIKLCIPTAFSWFWIICFPVFLFLGFVIFFVLIGVSPKPKNKNGEKK